MQTVTQLLLPAGPAARCLPPAAMTHEQYLARLHAHCIARMESRGYLAHADVLRGARLTYGGLSDARGIIVSDGWQRAYATSDYINICASGEETPLQLAGTVLHALGHVLAGCQHGHDDVWRQACKSLGLLGARQAQSYCTADFDTVTQTLLLAIPQPSDGQPKLRRYAEPTKVRPCSLGHGRRGGKSRGVGSGSRMRKMACLACGWACRTTSQHIAAGLPLCQSRTSAGGVCNTRLSIIT